MGHFFGGSDAPQGIALPHLRFRIAAVRRSQLGCQQGRIHVPRANAVDPDVRRQVQSQRFGQGHHRPFGGTVHRAAVVAADAGVAGNIDNAAALCSPGTAAAFFCSVRRRQLLRCAVCCLRCAFCCVCRGPVAGFLCRSGFRFSLRQHVGPTGLYHEESSLHVHVHDPVILCHRNLFDPFFLIDAGAVHQDIDPVGPVIPCYGSRHPAVRRFRHVPTDIAEPCQVFRRTRHGTLPGCASFFPQSVGSAEGMHRLRPAGKDKAFRILAADDLRQGLHAPGPVPAHEEDVCPVLPEGPGRGQSDAAGSAGNEHNFMFTSVLHV